MSRRWERGSTRRWRRVRLAVLARDGWVCQLCHEAIDPTLGARHPRSAQVHHTVDRDLVGDDPVYLVAAHKDCNTEAGDPSRAADPAPKPRTQW